MGIFSKRENTTNVQETVTPEITDALLKAIIDENAISKDQIMNIPKVAKSIHLLSDMVSMLPIILYEEKIIDGKRKVIEVQDDVRLKLLNDETGDTLDAVQFKRAIVKDYLLDGNAYAYINKNKNSFNSIHYVETNHVHINKNVDPIFKDYDILVNGGSYKPFEFLKITRETTDGVTGIGIIKENKELLKTAYETLMYEYSLVKTGGNKKGFVKSAKKLTQDALDKLKTAWQNLYSGKSEKVIVLNDGIDFQEASQTSVEMQMNEKKKTLDEQIMDLFNISTDFDKTVKEAIIPITNAIECALNKDFLLEKEKGLFYFAFDTTEITRGSLKERYEAYKVGLDANFLQIDEVRYKEDLEDLGLNFIKLGLNDVLYNPKTKEVYTPNTNKTTSIEGGEKNENRSKK